MNGLEKGFLGVAAVCAVVAGGWIFWDYGWDSVIDMTREVHGTLYWDLEAEPDEDGDGVVTGLVLAYDWRGDAPETIVVDAPGFALDGFLSGVSVDPGAHSVRLAGHGRVGGFDLSEAAIHGAVVSVRTSGSPPAR